MSKQERDVATDVFRYLDYRRYLMDAARELKSKGQFNVRQFARLAGLKAPGYLKMVVDGKRNLSPKSAGQFCQAIPLTGRQADYFKQLVLYNQTEDPDEKKKYLEALIRMLPRSSDFVLEKKQARLLSRPHYVCIRELVLLKDFKEDPKWIAKRLHPTISPQEAQSALDLLLELGLLKRDGSGRLKQTHTFVRTEEKNTQLVEAYHFHEAMIDQARRALSYFDQAERNYYSLTLPLTPELFAEAVAKFYRLRDRLVQKANEPNQNFSEVFQINFQLFPLTKKKDGGFSNEGH